MPEVLKKNYDVVLLTGGIIAAMVVRFLCMDYESGDFITFLKKWVEFYKMNGGWYALKGSSSDYNMLYQYILIIISYFNINCLYPIKIVSILFDVILALGCTGCLKALSADKKKQRLCFVCVLLLPTVFINSAFWAQCDSIYAAFIVWSIYFLVRNKNAWSIAFLAIAFSFKLQTVFVMPLYFIAFLKRQFKFRQLLVFPAVFFAVFIPALIVGKPLSELLYVYLNQTTEYPMLVVNAPTALQLLQAYVPDQALEKLFIALAGIFVLTAAALAYKKKLYPEKIPALALLFAIGIPFLLPHIHERYFYAAEILSIICVFACGKKYIPVMALTELSSLACYLHYFGFINMYAGKAISYLLSGTGAAVLMLLAFVLAVLHIYSTAGIKRYAAVISAVLLSAVTMAVSLSGRNISITMDGRLVNFPNVYPYQEQELFMVPIRPFSNAWGGTVGYNEETSRIQIQKDSTVIEFDAGSNTAFLNGQAVEMEQFYMADGKSFLSHKDIVNLMDLHCKIENNKLVFSSASGD